MFSRTNLLIDDEFCNMENITSNASQATLIGKRQCMSCKMNYFAD